MHLLGLKTRVFKKMWFSRILTKIFPVFEPLKMNNFYILNRQKLKFFPLWPWKTRISRHSTHSILIGETQPNFKIPLSRFTHRTFKTQHFSDSGYIRFRLHMFWSLKQFSHFSLPSHFYCLWNCHFYILEPRLLRYTFFDPGKTEIFLFF